MRTLMAILMLCVAMAPARADIADDCTQDDDLDLERVAGNRIAQLQPRALRHRDADRAALAELGVEAQSARATSRLFAQQLR